MLRLISLNLDGDNNYRESLDLLVCRQKKQTRRLCTVLIWQFSALFSESPVSGIECSPLRHKVHPFLSFLSLLISTSPSFSQGIFDSFGDRLPMQAEIWVRGITRWERSRWWGHLPAKRQKLMCTFASSQTSLQLMSPANMELNRRLQTAVGIKR